MRGLPWLLALSLALAPPLRAQDTNTTPIVNVADTGHVPKNDTAQTLPPEVRDSTAVSLPTEPPKDFADFLMKFLPLLVATVTTMLMSFFARFPWFAALGDVGKYLIQFTLGIIAYFVLRMVTGTASADLWAFVMAAVSGLIGMFATGWAYKAGKARERLNPS